MFCTKNQPLLLLFIYINIKIYKIYWEIFLRMCTKFNIVLPFRLFIIETPRDYFIFKI